MNFFTNFFLFNVYFDFNIYFIKENLENQIHLFDKINKIKY